jgi:hypothetical protein
MINIQQSDNYDAIERQYVIDQIQKVNAILLPGQGYSYVSTIDSDGSLTTNYCEFIIKKLEQKMSLAYGSEVHNLHKFFVGKLNEAQKKCCKKTMVDKIVEAAQK